MLDTKTIRTITEFVRKKPRNIHEIAKHIQRNWRTADSYVEKISKEQGILATRTFREGTRGALKIAYYVNTDDMGATGFQEQLYKKIETSREKEDFSPFDIYQYVPENERKAFLEEQSEDTITSKQDLVNTLRTAERQVLIFSGNISWVNASQEKKKILNIFEELAERNVSIKIICKVDLESIENIKKMLEINYKTKKENIEIRHAEQPFRAFIIDNKQARFKEIKHNYTQRKSSKSKTYIFYDITSEEWVEWMQKIFWNQFRTSISAEKRIRDIESIEKIK